MPKHSSIFLFSKTSYPDVNHIPILVPTYLHVEIDFKKYDYIIATSKETLTALEKIGNWKDLPVLAISDSTAAFVKKCGGKILDIADGYGKSIVKVVQNKYINKKALHPHAKIIAFDLEKALLNLHVEIESFIVYETSCASNLHVEIPDNSICIFTSPSSIKCFENIYEFNDTCRYICIGETTASALPKNIKYFISEKTSVPSTISKAKSLL